MLRLLPYGIVLVGVLACSFVSDVRTDSYVGYAYQEGTQNLIYTEHFTDTFVKEKQVSSQTNYYNPSNELIASRMLNFSHSMTAPDFKTEDARTGYMEGASVSGNKVRLYFKKNRKSSLEEKTITVPTAMVIDGGFNQFIKIHWTELQQGKTISLNFIVPCRLDYYALRARKILEKGNEMTVRIDPENMVARWLVDPILIKYNTSTKRIISYEGKSNISDDKGLNFITTLVYPDKGP